jgi:hypothetical protein
MHSITATATPAIEVHRLIKTYPGELEAEKGTDRAHRQSRRRLRTG